MEYPPEVLIYLQKFKLYLDNNEDAKKYFLEDIDSEQFFNYFLVISEKNFKRKNEPELTIEQLEFIRKIMSIFKKIDTKMDLIFEYKTNKIKFHLK